MLTMWFLQESVDKVLCISSQRDLPISLSETYPTANNFLTGRMDPDVRYLFHYDVFHGQPVSWGNDGIAASNGSARDVRGEIPKHN